MKVIPKSSLSDGELIAQYKQSGNLEVLAALYQPYMELVYAVCLKYLKEPETAKDAVLAIFEELVTKLKKHDIDNFKGWLYSLSKNHCLMQLRSAKHIKLQQLDPDYMQLNETVHLNGIMEKEENLDRLATCLETLSPEQKTIVELFYLQHKCYNEITAISGLDWNKVRSHIQNGRRNLKICMESKMQRSSND